MSLVGDSKFPEVIGVRAVQVLSGFRVHVTFTDGTEREIDLEPHLWGPVFNPIRNDPQMFQRVFVDPIGQTLAWPNDVDLAPESLYYDGEPPWAKEYKRRPDKVQKSKGQPSSRRRAPRKASRARG